MKKTNRMSRLLPVCYQMLPLTGNRLATRYIMFINYLYIFKMSVTDITGFVQIGAVEKIMSMLETKNNLVKKIVGRCASQSGNNGNRHKYAKYTGDYK